MTLDLGEILSTSEPIMWTIGMLRDPSINLTTASGSSQLRSSYYWSNFSTIPEAVRKTVHGFLNVYWWLTISLDRVRDK